MIFMLFIGLQTFKVKLFPEDSLWSNILNHLQTKVTPKNPHSCIFVSIYCNPKEVRVLTKLIFFRLANQKSFNAGYNNIILDFRAAIMDFFT